MGQLAVRKLADKSVGERVVVNDPETGEAILVDPETGTASPWPLLGIVPEGDLPEECNVSQGFVDRAVADGWASREGKRTVFRPSGPADDPWNKGPENHAFVHCDAVVFHFMEGDVRYKVTHQPDKYAEEGDDETPVTDEVYASGTTRVDWFYGLKLEEEKS